MLTFPPKSLPPQNELTDTLELYRRDLRDGSALIRQMSQEYRERKKWGDPQIDLVRRNLQATSEAMRESSLRESASIRELLRKGDCLHLFDGGPE